MQFQAKPGKKEYFFSQPHQPFFTLGMINALLFMLLFIPAFRGVIDVNWRYLHAYSMIFLVFTNFFFGFLYTTFPRFSGTAPIEPRRYLLVFLFNLLATITFLAGVWLPVLWYGAGLFMAASFGLTLREFYHIYKICTLPKKDQYWLIVGLGIGAMANILFLLALIPCRCNSDIFFQTGVEFGIYLYLLFIGFVVAFRMVPFFSHVMMWQKNERLHLAIFTLFALHSFLHGIYPKALFLVDLFAALLLANELKKIALPRSKDPLLWVLHLAIYWLPLGLFLGSIAEFFEEFFGWYSFALPLHILVLGFLTTILIGFGTRVTLGHSGNPLVADKGTVLIFYMTQIVLLGRILFSLAASFGKITPAFDIAATLWVLLILAWLWKYFEILAFGKSVTDA